MSNESYVKSILDGTADKEVIFDRLSDMAMDAMNSVSSIDELSKATLGSYVKKASKTATGLATNAMHLRNAARIAAQHDDDKSDEYYDHSAKATEKQVKRLRGVDNAVGKLTKESEDEQIDELSKATLGRYINTAATDSVKKAYVAASDIGKTSDVEKRKLFKKSLSRLDGVAKASGKLTKESYDRKSDPSYLPAAGLKAKHHDSLSAFHSEMENIGGTVEHKGPESLMFHVKNNKVHGIFNPVTKTGESYHE